MLDNIPKESQPRDDADGVIERDKANEWLKQNLIGKPVAFSAKITDVKISGNSGDYDVQVVPGAGVKQLGDTGVIGTVQSGKAEWPVKIGVLKKWSNLDEAAAKRLREFKGKTVTLAGNVTSAGFSYYSYRLEGATHWMPAEFGLSLSRVTIDGFDPTKK